MSDAIESMTAAAAAAAAAASDDGIGNMNNPASPPVISTGSPPQPNAEPKEEESVEEEGNKSHHHLVFFVHGYGANPRELEYLKDRMTTLLEQGAKSSSTLICDHSNTGKTKDGFDAGGKRLADSITEQVHDVTRNTKLAAASQSNDDDDVVLYLSLIGYSVGGNYCRSALKYLDPLFEDTTTTTLVIIPHLFCTIASPNLGLSQQTGFPIWFETMTSYSMGSTGRDLNRSTTMVEDMATTIPYLQPLSRFQHRIAVANAYKTDFVVPVGTAGFLSATSDYPHYVVDDTTITTIATTAVVDDDNNDASTASLSSLSPHFLTVETKQQDETSSVSSSSLTHSLDALGWTKIFCDLRTVLPGPAIPRVSRLLFTKKKRSSSPMSSLQQTAKSTSDTEVLTSALLYERLNQSDDAYWRIPLGHPVGIASQKHGLYRFLSKKGTPYANHLAQVLVEKLYTVSINK